MEPLSVSSIAVALLARSAHIMSFMHRRWDDHSRPAAERLKHELNNLRQALQKIEDAAASWNEPLPPSKMPHVLNDTRLELVNVTKVLTSEHSLQVDDMRSEDLLDALSGDLTSFDRTRARHSLPVRAYEMEVLVRGLSKRNVDLSTQYAPMIIYHHASAG